jgi:hypothetical protein
VPVRRAQRADQRNALRPEYGRSLGDRASADDRSAADKCSRAESPLPSLLARCARQTDTEAGATLAHYPAAVCVAMR